MQKLTLQAEDGYPLDLHVFAAEKPKAVIQLVHGMEEHQERYEGFIAFLNTNGFSVISSDLRGHGYNCPSLGFFKAKNGYQALLSDQKLITKYIQTTFHNSPIYILAHSFGTIITRVLLQDNSQNYQKVILSGYPNYQFGAHFGIIVSDLIKLFRGPKYKSKFLAKLSVEKFNQKIPNPKTPVDWVCANEETVQRYLNDPYCGFGFTCSAFNDLYHLMIMMHHVKHYHDINPHLKLLLASGADDPCTGFVKGTRDSYDTLEEAGFNSIETITYPGMRHEILAEKDRNQVYQDFLKFFN